LLCSSTYSEGKWITNLLHLKAKPMKHLVLKVWVVARIFW
jgi:hypothetical protein